MRVALSFVSADIGLRTTRPASKSSRAETSVPESYDNTTSVRRRAKLVALNAPDATRYAQSTRNDRSVRTYVRTYAFLRSFPLS